MRKNLSLWQIVTITTGLCNESMDAGCPNRRQGRLGGVLATPFLVWLLLSLWFSSVNVTILCKILPFPLELLSLTHSM